MLFRSTSGLITTTGLDEIVVAGMRDYSYRVVSLPVIGGVAADGATGAGQYSRAWYKIFNAGQTNITGTIHLATAAQWICDICAFKSGAAAGGCVKQASSTAGRRRKKQQTGSGLIIV